MKMMVKKGTENGTLIFNHMQTIAFFSGSLPSLYFRGPMILSDIVDVNYTQRIICCV